MPATTLTHYSIKRLREEGWIVDKAEYWNHFGQNRRDLFNFIDVMALKPKKIMAVQVTSRDQISVRRNKIFGLDKARAWLEAGGLIEIHGWDKPRGRWRLKVEAITMELFLANA